MRIQGPRWSGERLLRASPRSRSRIEIESSSSQSVPGSMRVLRSRVRIVRRRPGGDSSVESRQPGSGSGQRGHVSCRPRTSHLRPIVVQPAYLDDATIVADTWRTTAWTRRRGSRHSGTRCIPTSIAADGSTSTTTALEPDRAVRRSADRIRRARRAHYPMHCLNEETILMKTCRRGGDFSSCSPNRPTHGLSLRCDLSIPCEGNGARDREVCRPMEIEVWKVDDTADAGQPEFPNIWGHGLAGPPGALAAGRMTIGSCGGLSCNSGRRQSVLRRAMW